MSLKSDKPVAWVSDKYHSFIVSQRRLVVAHLAEQLIETPGDPDYIIQSSVIISYTRKDFKINKIRLGTLNALNKISFNVRQVEL